MGERYEDIDPGRRLLRRDKAQAAADWAAVSSPFGGVILRLRARARGARRSALIFLVGLVLTVLAGLSYYLLLPFWENYVDNREATLDATLAGIEEEDDNLDRDRNALIRRDASEEDEGPGLALLLRGQFESLPVPGSEGVGFRGTATLPRGGLLVYGSTSTLLRLSADGSAPQRLTVPGSEAVWFRGTAALPGGGLLVYGDESTLIRLPADGGAPERLPVPGSQTVRFWGTAALPDGGLLVWGDESTLIRLPANGGAPELIPVPVPEGVAFRGTAALPGGGLLVYFGSTLLRLPADGGAPEPIPVPGSKEVRFYGTAALPGGGLLLYGTGSTLLRLPANGGAPVRLQVPGPEQAQFLGTATLPGGGLLVYGTGSTLMRLPANGGVPERLTGPESQTVVFSGTAALPDGGLLVYGTGSTLMRLTGDGGAPERLTVPGSETVDFRGTAALPGGGLLVYGNQSTLMRLPASGGAPVRLTVEASQTVRFLDTATLPGGGLLVYGTDSTLMRLPADGGAPVRLPVPGSEQAQFLGTAALPGGGLLVYGDRSTLIRTTDRWSEAAAELDLSDGAEGDAALARFLDTTLSAHLRDWPPVADIRDELAGIENQRAALELLRERTKKQLDGLDEFPYAQWRRDRLRLDFANFLKTCRGADNQGAEITAACLDAWQERQASADSWWQTLADQVPPGILILFLLATTAALYRYNLRLAGFHDSRADALELLRRGRSDEELRDILATSPGEAVNLATVFLAADKVEQGTIRAKLGQAEVELAKALGTDR